MYVLTNICKTARALRKTLNGMDWNGMEWNGTEWNGILSGTFSFHLQSPPTKPEYFR